MNASTSPAQISITEENRRVVQTETTAARISATMRKTPRAPRLRTIAIVVAAVFATAWAIRYGLHLWRYEETDNAYLTGHVHQVSAQISGQVKTVLVRDNQLVKAGDVIAEIDPLEYEIGVQRATAGLSQARAQEAQTAAAVEQAKAALAEAQARAAQAASQISQIEARLTLDKLNLTRAENLFGNGAGAMSQSDVDSARSAYDSTSASLAAARANLAAAQAAANSVTASRDAARAQADAARAATSAAEAALREAQRQLSLTHVTAPADGRIGARTVEAGNRVQSGQLLCALTEPAVWVVANFKETQLARMRAGQEVDVTIDALPGEKLDGHIESFSPASGAQFALLPPDNATGNFNKVVQRIPVKITIDPQTVARLGDRLHLGYSVVAEVRVR